jgi:hypothetical protein
VNATKNPVLLILDASAILAYTRGSDHVGEPLGEVGADGGVVGLPIQSLVTVYWAVDNRDVLELLINHPVTEVLATPEDWTALAQLGEVVGLHEATSAALSAIEFNCDVLTARPGLYSGLADGGPVIPISA